MAKIKKITVQNLKAVSKLSVDFNGCSAIITGRNNSGKSSFLKSFPDRLRGLRPELVLKNDEKEGFSELVLTTGERFIWTFTPKGEKLTFITERNIKAPLTKDIAGYYFPKVFDVDRFLNSSPKDQKAILQGLTGIDFTDFNKKYQDAYDNRTFFNKQYAVEKAKAEFIDPTVPDQEIPTEEIIKEISGIEAHNMRFAQVSTGLSVKKLTKENNLAEINRLEELIKDLKFKNNGLEADIISGEKWMAEEKNKLKDKTVKEELELKLKEARELNKKIQEKIKAQEQDKKIDKAREDAEKAEAEVKRIEAEKLDVIRNASMPEGFGLSEDGITYNGFEFSKQQLSSSGIYIAALKLAALNLGEVKTLHFDASFLDKNSLEDIEKWAESNDLQLLIERPDFEGGEITYELICPKEEPLVDSGSGDTPKQTLF